MFLAHRSQPARIRADYLACSPVSTAYHIHTAPHTRSLCLIFNLQFPVLMDLQSTFNYRAKDSGGALGGLGQAEMKQYKRRLKNTQLSNSSNVCLGTSVSSFLSSWSDAWLRTCWVYGGSRGTNWSEPWSLQPNVVATLLPQTSSFCLWMEGNSLVDRLEARDGEGFFDFESHHPSPDTYRFA